MFTIFIEKNVYANTTTFDKEKVLSPEKQAEYDKLRNRNLKTLKRTCRNEHLRQILF